MHFCCDKLVDLAVLRKAKPCKDQNPHVDNASKECSLGHKNCCSNDSFSKEPNNNLQNVQFEFSLDNIVFLQTFFQTYVDLFKGLERKVLPFVNYDPPSIDKDILVLHETFLL